MRRALLLALALASCGGGEGRREESLERLERLAFVPAGRCVLPRGQGAGIDCSTHRPLLVDRFEVTRGEWLAWVEHEPAASELSAASFAERWGEGHESWPASWMTVAEARRFAQARGLRLLDAREWMRAAAGTSAQRLPWGARARSVSNSLELGLGRPSAVGTFENGRSAEGLYDLVGNVAEWVEGALGELEATLGGERAWAMGGSFLTRTRELHAPDAAEPLGLRINAETLPAQHRSRGVGLRVCADAETYLRRHARQWSGARAGRTLRAVGRGWGPVAVPLLEQLALEADAPPAIAELLAGARR